MISAVVLTKNEENNIEKCLSSLSWCDEIVILDDYSEDKTLSIVNCQLLIVKKKIKVFRRHLKGDFAGQRNFGLSKTKGDWVLFVDADEVVSDELKKEILSLCYSESCYKNHVILNSFQDPDGIPKQVRNDNQLSVQNDTVGYFLKRKDYFLGRWLKHGETGNIKLLRLGRRGRGEWEGKIHEVWKIKGKIGHLQNPIYHYPHHSISSFLEKINQYTDIVAQCWREKGKEMSFGEILFYPAGKFLQNYIFRAGFMDGVPGLIMAFMMSFHSFLARGKLWMLRDK